MSQKNLFEYNFQSYRGKDVKVRAKLLSASEDSNFITSSRLERKKKELCRTLKFRKLQSGLADSSIMNIYWDESLLLVTNTALLQFLLFMSYQNY